MAYFGQDNYNQPLGNSNYTIAQAGCLLTAICNLLIKFDGSSIDPPAMDAWFLAHDDFIYDSTDRANDDLAANSITKYDSTIINNASGSGAGVPSDLAIVKFHYNGVHTGEPIDHYCAVDHIDNNGIWIIDSWDGIVKAPSAYEGVYHQPVSWWTYTKNVDAPPLPPVVPPAPIPAPSPQGALTADSPSYKPIIKNIPGYMTATNAANHTNQVSTVKAGVNYFIFTSKYGMDNVTLVSGSPGAWINPADNVVDIPEPTPTPSIDPVTPEAQLAQPAWQTTYQPYRNKFGDVQAEYYVAMRDIQVVDMTGNKATLTMHQYNVTAVSGEFTYDNVVYCRPQSATDKYLWYGIEKIDFRTNTPNIELESDVYSTETNAVTRKITRTSKPSDYIVLAAAKLKTAEENIGRYMDIIINKKRIK